MRHESRPSIAARRPEKYALVAFTSWPHMSHLRRHSGRPDVRPRWHLPPFGVGPAGVVLPHRQGAGRRGGGSGAVAGEAHNPEKKARARKIGVRKDVSCPLEMSHVQNSETPPPEQQRQQQQQHVIGIRLNTMEKFSVNNISRSRKEGVNARI